MLKKVHLCPVFGSSALMRRVQSNLGVTSDIVQDAVPGSMWAYAKVTHMHKAAEGTEPVPLPDFSGALNV